MTCLKKQIKTHKFIQTGKDLFILATYKKSTLIRKVQVFLKRLTSAKAACSFHHHLTS